MKKIIALVLSVVMVLALAACGGQEAANTPAAGTENNAEAAAIKVALLLSGSRGDGAYLDYVCAGADKAAAELPIELKVLEIADAADYESNLVAMADAGYDVIIGGSTWFAEPITTHAAEYPNVKFIELDGVAEGENVVSVNFSFKDGGYLAGVAAAMLSAKTDIPGIDGAKVIGYVGGIDVPTLQWIEAGYKAGAASVDPDIQVLSPMSVPSPTPPRQRSWPLPRSMPVRTSSLPPPAAAASACWKRPAKRACTASASTSTRPATMPLPSSPPLNGASIPLPMT